MYAASHEQAARRIFNLGEAEPATHMDWARRFASALGWKGVIAESDDPNLPFARLIVGMDLSVPLMMATTRIRSELGFKDPVSLEAAIDQTLAG